MPHTFLARWNVPRYRTDSGNCVLCKWNTSTRFLHHSVLLLIILSSLLVFIPHFCHHWQAKENLEWGCRKGLLGSTTVQDGFYGKKCCVLYEMEKVNFWCCIVTTKAGSEWMNVFFLVPSHQGPCCSVAGIEQVAEGVQCIFSQRSVGRSHRDELLVSLVGVSIMKFYLVLCHCWFTYGKGVWCVKRPCLL